MAESVVSVKSGGPEPAGGGLDPKFVRGRAPKRNESVIIVGGGLAGMCAAISALDESAKVVLIATPMNVLHMIIVLELEYLEKEKMLGGNSAKASSGISACGTLTQKNLGIDDMCEKFHLDTMASGAGENDYALVDVLIQDSAQAVQFLIDKGVNLTDINLCGGHSAPRTHWLPSPKEGKPLPVGVAITRTLSSYLDEWSKKNPDQLRILTNSSVIGLVTWNDYVTGVRVRNSEEKVDEIKGKAVIMTTGGYSSDFTGSSSLLMEFTPKLAHLPTTNGPFATGDGVKMARAMGAALVGMDKVQVHPTAFIDPKDPGAKTKFLAAEALRGKGAILINEKCMRFSNELGRRDYLTEQINKNCARQSEVGNLPVAYMLLNDVGADSFGRPAFNFYSKIKGFFTEYDSAKAFSASQIGCDPLVLEKTLNEYNGYYESAAQDKNFRDPFNKAVFPVRFELSEKLYVAKVTPAVHYTMGGLKFDIKGYVFNELLQKPFQGLLAAGEVTGGVHGRNRLAGNSLLECVVFGRIAGHSAAAIDYHSDVEHTPTPTIRREDNEHSDL